MTDIIDRIDELVDEQLAAGEPETGYDYGDPQYPRCPHCGRHWHGLPITQRIADMYRWRQYDPDYVYAEDDSPLLCEGSDFIGPQRPPPSPWSLNGVHAARDIQWGIVIGSAAGMAEAIRESMRRFREQMEQLAAAFEPLLLPTNWRLSTGDWYQQSTGPVILYDEAYRLPAEPPTCLRADINWTPGPHNWHYELQRPPLQFPRSPHPFFRYVSPAEALIRQLWPEFNAPEHQLPEHPGYDFTKYDLDPAHGVFAQPIRRGRR